MSTEVGIVKGRREQGGTDPVRYQVETISVARFNAGPGRLGVQLSLGGAHIQLISRAQTNRLISLLRAATSFPLVPARRAALKKGT